MKPITVCLTSCNRFDLLKSTLDSFFSLNAHSFLIEKIMITEDSGNLEMTQKILNHYGDKVELIFNEKNIGLLVSIDNMYAQVQTPYIFHCEDDWFFQGNPNFLKESLEILEDKNDIHQVWLRPIHPAWLRPIRTIFTWIEFEIYETSSGLEYAMIAKPHYTLLGDWCGFSFNPGLRRLSDYKQMFPAGYSEFILPGKSMVYSEHNCNKIASAQGYRAAILLQSACDHIGQGRSTYT